MTGEIAGCPRRQWPERRRSICRRGVTLTLCAASAAGALVWSMAVASPAPEAVAAPSSPGGCIESGVTGVDLSWYPGAETGFTALAAHDVHSAPELLDALARDFANGPRLTSYGETTTGEPSMQDFIVLWLPVWLNQVVSGTAINTHGLDPAQPDDMGKILWVAHVAGYYGGVWLRKDFLDFDVPVHGGVPFSNSGIDQFYSNFIDDVRAIAEHGSDSAALTMARTTLRSDLVIPLSGVDSSTVVSQILPPRDNLAAFGYDSTWLANILPPHLDAPFNASPRVDNLFVRDQNKLLDARYGIPELPYLTDARSAYQRVESATGTVRTRYRQTVDGNLFELPLLLSQNRFSLYGHLVYGVGILAASNYRGFNQEQYDRVLTWATYAVMGNQANAMNAISAYAEQNVPAARRELQATSVWAAYVGAYAWGHLNLAVTAAQSMETLLPSFEGRC
jgi:hypothetical protein